MSREPHIRSFTHLVYYINKFPGQAGIISKESIIVLVSCIKALERNHKHAVKYDKVNFKSTFEQTMMEPGPSAASQIWLKLVHWL